MSLNSRERLIVIVDLSRSSQVSDNSPNVTPAMALQSPLLVFGSQVKSLDGGSSYEIGDQVMVDVKLDESPGVLARVKEIFVQDITSLCIRRYLRVKDGQVVSCTTTAQIGSRNLTTDESMLKCSYGMPQSISRITIRQAVDSRRRNDNQQPSTSTASNNELGERILKETDRGNR